MSKPKHQAFLDLEEALARRLSGAWSRYWTDIERRMRSSVEAGQFDQAHALAESIDVGPLFQRNRRFAQTVGMAALLLGASRVKPHRASKVAAKPPKRELEKLLDQTQIMLARNASQKLRDLAHAWVHEEETKLIKFDPSQPRHPKGTPEGGQWADLKVVAGADGSGSVRIVVRNESVKAKDPATIEARPWTVLEADDQPRKGLQVNWSEVADKWQGAGLGVRIYAKLADYAHSRGMTLFSDSQVSADAQRIYEALRRRGYQVEQNPKAVSTNDGKLIVGWPTLPRDQWVYRVTNPLLTKRDTDGAQPLYVCRRLLNTEPFVAWAKSQGFTAVDADLHVTVVYSQTPVDWGAVPAADRHGLSVATRTRSVVPLGDGGAVVLKFDCPSLHERWQAFRDAGCSWDYEGYQPHVTITYEKPADLDLSTVEPYAGVLQFGPEDFEPLSTDESVEKFDPAQPRHPKGTPEGGQWVHAGVPVEPGTTPIPEGHVRLHHQTTPEAMEKILREGIKLSEAKGIEGPRAIYADEKGFYGKPSEHPTIEFHVPKDQWGPPFVRSTEVPPEAIIAGHLPWHTQARYLGADPAQLASVLAGEYDDMLDWPSYGPALRYLKRKYGKAEKIEKRERPDHQAKINVAGKNYLGLASSVQVSRLSAFGFLLEAAEAGIVNYRIDAVLDERTCAVCQQLDGWVFPVEQGMQLAQLIMDTDDPDALKQIAPFYAQNKQAVAELITYSTDDWVAMGMHLPPYHPLCRCILTPTDQKSDLHPTQIEDRVALAAQTLYGEGEGVRLTRELFGVEPQAQPQRLGDVVPDLALEAEDVASWLDMVRDSGESGESVASVTRAPEKAAEWIQDVITEWLAPPSADVPAPPLITPTLFEGSTVPQDYVEPFRPSRLAQITQSRWPWLAGIFGWLALRDPAATEEAARIAEEEAADDDRDDRDDRTELREDRRR